MDLKNKAALITGGTRMGRAVARALARKGCGVAVSYFTSKTAALETMKGLRGFGVKTLAVKADVRRNRSVEGLMSAVSKTFGRLDVLVNMASTYEETPLKTLSSGHDAAAGPWRDNLDVHLNAAWRLSLGAAALMRRAGGGRMIHFADWTAASGRPRYLARAPYYVSKAGLKAMVEVLALELAPRILVNAVAPGPILPPEGLSRKAAAEAVKNTPLGRWGGAEEIARAVVFLAETDFITGECLRVDGGRHLY